MSDETRIKKLEERVAHLESFIMESLIFRLDELNDYVHDIPEHGEPPKEVDPQYSYLRHVIDKARVAGWKDKGEWG